MKVSGNAAASEFFSKHGGSHLLAPSTEGKIKYTSQAALAYKEELKRRLAADASPGQISDPVVFPGLSGQNNTSATSNGTSSLGAASGAAGDDDDDFFDDWEDKPKQAKPIAKPVVAKSATPSASVALPGIGRPRPQQAATASSSPATGKLVDAPAAATVGASPTLAPPTQLNSSSLRPSSRNSTLGAVRSGASTPTGSTGSGPSSGGSKLGGVKRGGLGAKKGGPAIDFEAAERKAKEEEALKVAAAQEAEARKEADRQAEELAKQAVLAAAQNQRSQAATQAAAAATASSPKSPTGKDNARSKLSGEVDRLGMGFGRIAVRQGHIQDQLERERQAKVAARSAADAEMPDYARSKFASQKSISSDQYFERGGYDANLSSEAKERLAGLQGATSISSNQYFGREDPEDDGEGVPVQQDGDWAADLEVQAREMYSRFMANPDVQSGIESFRAGAMKLSQYLEDMSRNGA